jgi:pimeloyl-ACP methyl ester carboxylesterase
MVGTQGLHTRTWGSGDRTALLLHGQFGSSESWWAVAPRIAERGYRVVAIDLPGHGESRPDPEMTLALCVDQVVNSCPDAEVAVGHSLGALVLAHSAHRIGARRTVYVDSPFDYRMRVPGDEYRRRAAEVQAVRTFDWLVEHRPHWSEHDCRVEARAAERFDVETSLSLMTSMSGIDHHPEPGPEPLAIVPRPSEYLSPDEIVSLQGRGFRVHHVDGAGHTVWFGHVDEFLVALEPWL